MAGQLACAGPTPVLDPGAGDPLVTTTTSTDVSTGAPGTTSTSSGSSTRSGSEVGGDSTSTDDSVGVGFITDPDTGPSSIECSIIEQDCPRGEKCNMLADDGGMYWNATRCFPVPEAPDGVDAPCVVEGSPLSGVDSCDIGAVCLHVDPETLQGTCVSYCTGSNAAPICEDPNRYCQISGDGVPALCIPYCDPLDPAACPRGQGCYPADDRFICFPDASGNGGGLLEDCAFVNGCNAGLFCAHPDFVGLCEADVAGCCTPYCDQADPACPQGAACHPYFEPGDAPPDLANLGLCAIP